jgi:cytidine deaminase
MSSDGPIHRTIHALTPAARTHVTRPEKHQGFVPAEIIARLLDLTGLDLNRLMSEFLPIAANLAKVPISGFRVGAVVACGGEGQEAPDLYLGANYEFTGASLELSVHAEQSAVMSAWLAGAGWPRTIASSASPCGLCRQFLRELEAAASLRVVMPASGGEPPEEVAFDDLLPQSFGPADLGVEAALMARRSEPISLSVDGNADDDLLQSALEAARFSYAPYTGAYAGCAILLSSGRIRIGRYAENAAYNPSISPLQCAIARIGFTAAGGDERITRVILVERPTRVTQRPVTERLLRVVAPEVVLEYHEARGTRVDRCAHLRAPRQT